jgi:hypothetical protein
VFLGSGLFLSLLRCSVLFTKVGHFRISPIFTQVRGSGILRTSPFGHSRKFATASNDEITAKITLLSDVPGNDVCYGGGVDQLGAVAEPRAPAPLREGVSL